VTENYSVPLTTLVKEFDLRVIHESSDYPSIRLTVEDVARPGLQLAGYFDHFEPMRLQVMGNVEMSYLGKLPETERRITFDRLFSYKFPALLIARDMQPDEACLDMAKKHNVTILGTREATSTIISTIIIQPFTIFVIIISYHSSIRVHQPNRVPSTISIRRQTRILIRHRIHTKPTGHQIRIVISCSEVGKACL
jgi:HPr kinase/phosphorylase